MLKMFFVRNFPAIGKYKRYMVSIYHFLILKKSYSQKDEDQVLLSLLKKIKRSDVDYIDIGSNHPSDISNTYLLYRNGYNGILIEPNAELCNLSKKFRKKDKVLNIGVGIEVGVYPFYLSNTPVASSFLESHLEQRDMLLWGVEYVPVLSVDTVVKSMGLKSIGVLSIDVEGWNYDALISAKDSLDKVSILCIEYDDRRNDIIDYLSGFELIDDNGCNLIMLNKCNER